MTGAFLFLTLRSFRNRLVSQLRRLKRPRYLLFAVVGLAYFYAVAGRHWATGFRTAARSDLPSLPSILPELLGACFILINIVVAWCTVAPLSPLAFTEAEIQHLFTAPIPRRALIRWKLMRGQIGVLFSVTLITLMAGSRFSGGGRVLFFAGMWVAFATMQLHLTGIRMTLHGLQRRGVRWGTRLTVVLLVTAAALTATGFWLRSQAVPLPAGRDFREVLAALGRFAETLAGSGPAWLILLPGRLMVRPALAPDLPRFLLALAPALLLLLANYLWVMRSGVALEEGAMEAARRLEEHRAARVSGRPRSRIRFRLTRTPFNLSPVGRPEVALLWKNLIAGFRNVGGLRVLALILGAGMSVLVLVVRSTGRTEVAIVAGGLCGMFAGIVLIAGPAILRIDFRQDLPNMDTLRSYPISGRSLLIGTLLAPMLVLTGLEWMLLAAFTLLTSGWVGGESPWGTVAPLAALAGAILTVPLIGMTALIHNAAFVLAPAWVSMGPARSFGVERIGQSIFATLGMLLVMAFSLIPASLVFGVSWLLCSAFLGGAISIPLSALPAAAMLAAEWWLGVTLLGASLDRFDPSRELDSLTSTS